jgi:hypothetical protein
MNVIRRKRPLWGPTLAATGWGESTFAEQAWYKSRGASLRWAIAGGIVGLLIALSSSPRLSGWRAGWLRRAMTGCC